MDQEKVATKERVQDNIRVIGFHEIEQIEGDLTLFPLDITLDITGIGLFLFIRRLTSYLNDQVNRG